MKENEKIAVGQKNIVKYSPEFNNFNVSDLSRLEIDLFITIITQMKDEETNTKKISFSDLKKLMKFKHKGKQLKDVLKLIPFKFIKSSYSEVNKVYDDYGNDVLIENVSVIPIFSKLQIEIDHKVISNSYLIVKVSDEVSSMLNNIDKWVIYDLSDFVSIKNKYAKILFKYLKQFRGTGYVNIPVEKYKRLLGISNKYKNYYIYDRYVKKQIVELAPFFENLSVTRKYAEERGKPLKNLIFKFKPEKDNYDLSDKNLKKGYKKRPNHSQYIEKATDWSNHNNNNNYANANANAKALDNSEVSRNNTVLNYTTSQKNSKQDLDDIINSL